MVCFVSVSPRSLFAVIMYTTHCQFQVTPVTQYKDNFRQIVVTYFHLTPT